MFKDLKYSFGNEEKRIGEMESGKIVLLVQVRFIASPIKGARLLLLMLLS